ncbi:MAG: hypothetical protein NVSMB32_17420 [Actinomycetota bacterium]
MSQAAEPRLAQVMLGWLLNWASCPDRGLSGPHRKVAAAAREAAAEGVAALASATAQDLRLALDAALTQFPNLCPDVPEERRLRMAARLARVLEGDRTQWLSQQYPAAGIPPPGTPPGMTDSR